MNRLISFFAGLRTTRVVRSEERQPVSMRVLEGDALKQVAGGLPHVPVSETLTTESAQARSSAI